MGGGVTRRGGGRIERRGKRGIARGERSEGRERACLRAIKQESNGADGR